MPLTLTLRFYAELGDFLPAERRFVSFTHQLAYSTSVKDLIEGLGVPHTEVDLVLVNGNSVGFDTAVRDGDRVAVYPVFESLDVSSLNRLRPEPLRQPRFILDVHLGRLARALRLLGLDCAYRNDYEDAEIVSTATREGRIILTRDRGLLKHRAVTHGTCLRSTATFEQIVEVLKRFDLAGALRPLSRCATCNGELAPVALQAIERLIPPRVRERCREFRQCRDCGQIYWEGSHVPRIHATLAAARRRALI